MNPIEEAGAEYCRRNPEATFQHAKQHAKNTYADQESVISFLRGFSGQETRARESRTTVDRNWPGEKGY